MKSFMFFAVLLLSSHVFALTGNVSNDYAVLKEGFEKAGNTPNFDSIPWASERNKIACYEVNSKGEKSFPTMIKWIQKDAQETGPIFSTGITRIEMNYGGSYAKNENIYPATHVMETKNNQIEIHFPIFNIKPAIQIIRWSNDYIYFHTEFSDDSSYGYCWSL